MNAVILLGPPGAGKGTVAEVLVGQGYKHISTGQLLREQIARRTVLGIQAEKLMEQGRFVPDDVVVGMIRNLLEKADGTQKFLFDGFPRTLPQAKSLDKLLSELEGTLESVVLLDCPDDVIIKRLSGRRTCDKCGAVYHIAFNPPSHGDRCDVEGCKLVQRADDREETVRNRLKVYEQQTAPLISYYEAKSLVEHIDANQSIEAVRNDVNERLVGVAT
ncbi:adenylate kinase [Pontiella agarivorans]|uniref:Adenylate kinase n=1 Tax=Pontiella agarivorans TaxID=3038953 RepID=A0ABU5MZP3_9BACT|nr:adenylate kinase [Pontiella agarivorans]MDZ8119639.1 adenylate kinase [Pontiella agarivorans]